MFYKWHTWTEKSIMRFFFSFPWQRSSVYSASCSAMLYRKCFAASKHFFLQFLFSSVPPAFSSIPSPLSLSVLSLSLIFWSIFYALLHYSQPPFTLHYILPSFPNTLYTSLSFLQSLCFPSSFPPSFSSSAHFPLLPPFTLFIIPLSLLWSRRSDSFPLYLCFPSSLSFSEHHAVRLQCCHPPF